MINFFQGGLKNAPSIIGRTCAFALKIWTWIGRGVCLSAYLETTKKFFKFWDFPLQLPAFLIENLTQIMGFLDTAFEVCGLCW
ncbi:MAG: hypothetical protein ACYSTG_10955, partial [Planctomycetota bacterium]